MNVNTFLKPWQDYGDYHSKHKDSVWRKAWENQALLVKWPPRTQFFYFQEEWDRARSFKEWKDRISANEEQLTLALSDYKNILYARQFEDLYDMLAPVEFKGGKAGFDQMMLPPNDATGGGGGPGPGFAPGAGAGGQGAISPKTLFTDTPTLEEAWLAQEDFWIKREVLRSISQTLGDLAEMAEVKLDAKEKKEGFFQHRRFRNKTWEIDLLFAKNDEGKITVSPESTIKNIDKSRRVLYLANPRTHGGIVFRLQQGTIEPYYLEIKGEPLAYNGSTKIKESHSFDRIDLTQKFTMEQTFDWAYCPVRRIDDIRLGVHSHRTAIVTQLKPNPNFLAVNRPGPGGPGGGFPPGAPPGPAPGGAPVLQPGAPPPGPGGPGAVAPGDPAANPVTEPNKLIKNRYISATDQCRLVPLGLVLIVEQEHIHEILTNLTSSMLRFQITQVQVQHVRNVQSQEALDEAAAGPGTTPGAGPAAPVRPAPGPMPPGPGERRGFRGRRSMEMRQPGGPPGPGPMAQPPGVTATGNEADPNLVELTVYGIASLYERFDEGNQQGQGPQGRGGRGGPSGKGNNPGKTPPPGKGTNPPAQPGPAAGATTPSPAPAAVPPQAPAPAPAPAPKP